jgi:hypothetical protein
MNKSIIIQVEQDNFFFSIIKFIPGCFLQECPQNEKPDSLVE